MASSSFKRFDVVSFTKDHKFHKRPTNPSHENISKEWKVLEERLSSEQCSIFVRAYEARIDLLRAVIVGGDGTPYHHGLFFFDIQFPSNYPNDPPKVCYNKSYGKIPNLCGRNIFKTSEVQWDPLRSTIFEVLLSIQTLVLSYRTNTSQRNDEKIFLSVCETALLLLKEKPRNFEDFVGRHYMESAGPILRSCKAYANGLVRVGHYGSPEFVSGSINYVTKSFRKSTKEVYNKLLRAFKKDLIWISHDLVDFEDVKIIEEKEKDKKRQVAGILLACLVINKNKEGDNKPQ